MKPPQLAPSEITSLHWAIELIETEAFLYRTLPYVAHGSKTWARAQPEYRQKVREFNRHLRNLRAIKKKFHHFSNIEAVVQRKSKSQHYRINLPAIVAEAGQEQSRKKSKSQSQSQ